MKPPKPKLESPRKFRAIPRKAPISGCGKRKTEVAGERAHDKARSECQDPSRTQIPQPVAAEVVSALGRRALTLEQIWHFRLCVCRTLSKRKTGLRAQGCACNTLVGPR